MLQTVVAGVLLMLQPSTGLTQDLGRIGLPLLVSVPTAPIPVLADGNFRLVYQLHLTNTSAKPVMLTRVDAADGVNVRLKPDTTYCAELEAAR